MFLKPSIPLLLFLGSCLAKRVSGVAAEIGRPRHEKRDAPAEGFVLVSPAPADSFIKLRIALVQKDFAGLESALYKASTPGSASYGEWLSKSQVEAYASPSNEAAKAVQSWLSAHGLTSSTSSPAGDWVTVNMTVSQANSLLHAEFTTFKFEEDAGTGEIVRTLSYNVPAEVKGYVNTIHPTISFPVPRPQDSRHATSNFTIPHGTSSSLSPDLAKSELPPLPASCIPPSDHWSGWQAPYHLPCRFDFYGIPKELPPAQVNNSLWISGFDFSFVHKARVRAYLSANRPDLGPLPEFHVISINGGVNNQLPVHSDSEPPVATGMMNMAASTAHNVPLTFMIVGTDNSLDFMDWLLSQADYLLGMEDSSLPKVIVFSHAAPERLLSKPLVVRLCAAYAQLSARGVTLIHSQIASQGVDAWPYWDSNWPGPRECPSGFDVSFPASCPYVTSVGISLLDVYPFKPDASHQEMATEPTNGGWSGVFSRPLYQDTDVTDYLDVLGDKHSGMFDPAGRATPDLAAFPWMNDPYVGPLSLVVENGAYAATLVASMIAIINGERMAAGMSTMGFLNPWIYQNKEAFNDITIGSNPGCMTDGFSAAVGWDPVSGVGSPMYARVRAAAGLN